jgi:sec-independent protein translocase protein TatA
MTPLAHTILAGLPGSTELWIVLFIVLLLFGRRLPGLARSMGQGISSFKKGLNEPLEDAAPPRKMDEGSSASAPKARETVEESRE